MLDVYISFSLCVLNKLRHKNNGYLLEDLKIFYYITSSNSLRFPTYIAFIRC